MKNVKKHLAVIFAMILCCFLCITATASETETTFDPGVTSAENTNFAWSLDTAEESETKGTLTISYNGNDTQLYLDNKDAAQKLIYADFMAWKDVWNSSVTRIVVEGFTDNAVRVQSGASVFSGWNELQSVRIEPVENKGTWYFRNFWMSTGWFQNCPKLTTVSIGGNETSGVVDISGWGRYYRGFTYMFKECDLITTVIFPETLTDTQKGKTYETAAGIHAQMFTGAASLKNIEIPTWALSIDNYAFSGCTSLESITIPASVKTIGTSAFGSATLSKVKYPACTALSSLTLENGVETIGASAFNGCSALTYLEIPASVTSIGASAFSGTGITEIKLLGTDTSTFTMDTTAFDDVSALKAGVVTEEMKAYLVESYGFTADNVSVIIEGGFEDGELGWSLSGGTLTVFGSGTALSFGKEITAENLSDIPWYSYSDKIERIVVEANITSLCDHAFAGLESLQTVQLPASLTDFTAASVFSGDNALKSVCVNGSEAKAGIIDLFCASAVSADLFDGCNIDAAVYLPKLDDTGFLDGWSAELDSLTVATYPTSALATRIRERDDITLAYLPESYDIALARSGSTVGGNDFSWSFDDKTETLSITTTGLLRIFKANEANWVAWKNVWTDAVKHVYICENTVTLYINWSNSGSFFKNMKALESVHFETDSNIYIRNTDSAGQGLFYGCSALKTVSAGTDDTIDNVIDLSRIKSFQNNFTGMFFGCSSVERVVLPEVITNENTTKIDFIIAPHMFSGCTSLKEIVIPDCAEAIGNNAFKDCSSLERIVILNPNTDLSSAGADTFPAKDGLRIFVTSDNVYEAVAALSAEKVSVTNVGSAISSEGFSIRMTDYNGLRAIFAFDNSRNEELTALGFTLKEYGAIACSATEYDYFGGIELENVNGKYTPAFSAMKKFVVYDGERISGRILAPESIENADPNKIYYALSIVRYAKNFKSDLYMAAYAVYSDANGNDYYVYGNYGGDYEFVNLYGVTLDMYKNHDKTGITSLEVDETAVWNTVLQGALDGYRELSVGTDGLSVTVVTDGNENYAFVRNEKGAAPTTDEVSAAVAEIGFVGTIKDSFGVAIADMGTTAPTEPVATALNPMITTPNRYSRAEGAQHPQGMCTDGEHIYYSFTGKIVKVRMSDETEVGTVTVSDDLNKFDAHLGNLIHHKGKIYGSLSFWDSEKTYIVILNADDIVGDVTTDIMQATYLPVPEEYAITLFEGTEKEISTIRFNDFGLDSITVGKIPGKGFVLPDGSEIEDDNDYLVFGFGSPYLLSSKRYDDDNIRLSFVDIDEVAKNAAPIDQERIADETEKGIGIKYTAFVYAGGICVQVISYDKDNGDYHFACYARKDFDENYPSHDYFVIDGSKKLYLSEIEVGQSVPSTNENYEYFSECAAQYKDTEDLDRDGDVDEQMLGWTMELKCLCGRQELSGHDAIDYDGGGYAARICGMHHPGMADNGLISMGNDYFYAAYHNNEEVEGVTKYGADAKLYRLNRYNGAWTFVKQY